MENEISEQAFTKMMTREETDDTEKKMADLEKRFDMLERELRFLSDPDHEPQNGNMVEIEGGFFETMNALRSLYLDQEDDAKRIMKISKDIEKGRIKVDMTELFFRFFVRQEIQNARIKLLLLSQKLEVEPSLFDHLDDLSLIVDDPRYSIHQVIIGWKRFERMVTGEIKRLRS